MPPGDFALACLACLLYFSYTLSLSAERRPDRFQMARLQAGVGFDMRHTLAVLRSLTNLGPTADLTQ